MTDVKGQYAYVQVRAESIRQVAAAYDSARLEAAVNALGIPTLQELSQRGGGRGPRPCLS